MKVIQARVPYEGLEIQLDCGLTIFVYESTLSGNPVVEIITDTGNDDGDFAVEHGADEQPMFTVMVNEGVVYGD